MAAGEGAVRAARAACGKEPRLHGVNAGADRARIGTRMSPSDGTSARPRWLGLPTRIAFGFGAALLSLAVAAGASYAALTALAAASLLVRHTAEAQLAVEQIESALLVSRTALEAYVAEGERRHHARLLRAFSKVQPAVGSLQRISEQHPDEKPRIARLAADVDIVRSEHAQVLALVDGGDLQAARALAVRGLGREALERATRALEEIEKDEARAHQGREAAWSRSVLVSNVVFVAAVCVLLVLILLAARLVRDEIRGREAEAAARERTLVMQRRLMAVVSHDLRNPLTGILTAGWALARGDVSPEAVPMARRIVAAGRRMERLIRDLLDWSRMHGGAPIPIQVREADLHEVCRRMADELRDREGDRIRVVREGDTRAVFDPDRMEQVVGNLLSNALRHGPPGTPVRVRAVGTPHEVRLEVQDEGPGIPQEAHAEIFEPFRQGPGSHGSGVGLGLFIVRALVEAHGGGIDLDSAPGKTTFVVRLPRAASQGKGETRSGTG